MKLLNTWLAVALIAFGAASSSAVAQDSPYVVRVPVLAAEHSPLTTAFDFGTVIVGTQPSRGFTFTNRSAKATTLGAVQAIGKARILDHNCTGTLLPNESCALTLGLLADALGSNTGSVSVSHSQATAPDLYNLSATAVTSSVAIRFDEPTVNYGNQLLRTPSEPRTLTLRNTGSEDAELTAVRFSKSTTHYVIQDNTCEGTLPAGGSCQLSVVFRPQSLGPLSASLSYVLESGTVVNAASLLGTGVQGVPTWSASEVNVLDVAAGQESAPKSVTLTNTGLGTLGLSSLTLKDSSGEAQYFWISSTTCGASLLPGASCQVNIVFSAPDTAIRNAVLELQATGTTTPLSRVQVWARPVAYEALLSVDPVSLAFGDVAVGQPKTLPLTLRSVGQAPVSVSAYTFSGTNAADFVLVNPTECVGTLNPGMQCVLQVRVTPSAAGARAGTLTLTHTSSQPVSPVALSANGLLGELQVMPASLTFSPTNRGATSSQTLELKNVGAATLRISSLAVTSTQSGVAAMFSPANTCTGRDLAAGATCTLTVTYAPTTVATHAATLTVSHTGSSAQKTVPLNGSGTEPPAALAALTDFACPSPAQMGVATVCTATLSNPSTVAYTVTGVGTSSNTSFVPSFLGCSSGATLNPGASCTVRLTATFSATGTYTTSYQLATTAGPVSKTASLVVQAPVATLRTTSHGNVQIGSSATATHKLVNSGSLPVSLSMPATLSATGSTAFTVVSHTCPATLATGTSCDIVTRCTPTTTGTLTRGLNVASNASPAIAGTLSCEGLNSDASSSLLSFSPNPLTFGTTPVGSTTAATTVTVRNNNVAGAAAVSISGVTLSGAQASAFTVTGSTCYSASAAGSLASGATCTLTLTARPSVAGLNSGVLQLTTNLTGAAPQLAMSVTGAQAAFTISPQTQDFGAITAGAAVASRTYTVTNTGSAAGSLTSVLPASTSSPVFAFSHNCPASIAAGASCAVTVAINSTASASRTGAQTGTASVQFSTGPSVSLTALANIQPAPVAAGTVSISCPATAPLGVAFTCQARVTSTGTATLAVTSWAPTYQYNAGTWNAITASTATCSSTGVTVGAIPAGQYCTVNLSLTPNAAGTYTLRTAPMGSVAMTPAQASVTVQGPSLQLTTTNHPLTQVGASTTASHTLTNNGPVSVTVSAGTSSVAAITLNRSACTTLAPGQSCTVTTTCSPTAAGNLTSTLTLSGSPTVRASGSVTCTAQTGSGTMSVNGNSTTLAGGFTTSGNWMRLTNTGVGPLSIQAFYPAAGWALVGNPALASDCVVGKVLQASESCVFVESLTGVQGPNTTATGSQRVRTSVGDLSWSSAPLMLKGLSFTPLAPFGTVQVGDNVTAGYSVTNQAPTPTAMATTFAVTGTGLSVDSHTCPTTLASGATCQVTLRLVAPLTATTVSGTLSATTGYNALLSNQVQAGTARSGVQGSLSLSVPILAANATLVTGTNTPIAVGQSVDIIHELRNDGSAPVRITAAATLSSTTQHTLVGGTCKVGASVAPGASCTVVTRFAPTGVAQGAVTLTLGTSVGVRTGSFTGRVIPQTDVQVALGGPTLALFNESSAYNLNVYNTAGGPARVVVSFGSTNSAGAQAHLSGLTGNVCGSWSMTPAGAATQTAAATSSSTGVTCVPRVDMKQLELYLPASRSFSGTLMLNSGAESGTAAVSVSISVLEAQDLLAANNSGIVSTTISPAIELEEVTLLPAVVGDPYSHDFKQQLQMPGLLLAKRIRAADLDTHRANAVWSVKGTLPPGMTLSAQGVLSGIPTEHISGAELEVTASYFNWKASQTYKFSAGVFVPYAHVHKKLFVGSHSCSIMPDTTVQCWGANEDGQLGRGTKTAVQEPAAPVLGLSGVISIHGLAGATCALTNGDAVYCWGRNDKGQLGLGLSATYSSATPVRARVIVDGVEQPFVGIAGAGWTTCAISRLKGVYCWGYGNWGEPGASPVGVNYPIVSSPRQMLAWKPVGIVASGSAFCAMGPGGGMGILCWGSWVMGERASEYKISDAQLHIPRQIASVKLAPFMTETTLPAKFHTYGITSYKAQTVCAYSPSLRHGGVCWGGSTPTFYAYSQVTTSAIYTGSYPLSYQGIVDISNDCILTSKVACASVPAYIAVPDGATNIAASAPNAYGAPACVRYNTGKVMCWKLKQTSSYGAPVTAVVPDPPTVIIP